MNNINIFVSSTCYDLSQIRIDISEFIKNSGHNPILSEFENFPVAPELNTVENCIRNVKENADILVLIVGSRYGSVINNGKSITNTEFLVAKQKGIPIFCFFEKRTLVALSFWKKNKTADFSEFVDNVQIFEFMEEVRNNSKIWTFSFEIAQEIISTLKIQLSYLFKSSLQARKILDEEIPDLFKLNLSNGAIKIILEMGPLYEYAFLAQTFTDEIQKREFKKNDLHYSILAEPKHFIHNPNDIPGWCLERNKTITYLINSISTLVNVALPKFLNEPGMPADLKGLYYISTKYSEVFDWFLDWMLVTQSTYLPEKFEYLAEELSKIASTIIEDVWEFPFNFKRQIDSVLERISQGEKGIELTITLTLQLNDEALKKFQKGLIDLRDFYSKD